MPSRPPFQSFEAPLFCFFVTSRASYFLRFVYHHERLLGEGSGAVKSRGVAWAVTWTIASSLSPPTPGSCVWLALPSPLTQFSTPLSADEGNVCDHWSKADFLFDAPTSLHSPHAPRKRFRSSGCHTLIPHPPFKQPEGAKWHGHDFL